MAQPSLSRTAERLYESLAPLAWDDEANDWALAHLCQAIAKTLDEVADISRDDDETDAPGYSQLFDVDEVAEKYLPWLGQFIGVSVPDNLTDEAKRLRIRETDGFNRGTVSAISGAARQFLTGDKTVYVVERHGSAYRLTVSTLDSETPDVAAVEAALQEQIPAGIVWTLETISPTTFNALRDTHSDFDQVTDTFVNFNEIILNPTKLYNYVTLLSDYASYAALGASFTDYADLRTAS